MSDSVQQIKDKLPIVDVVSGYVKLERAGKNLRARCPFHKERTPSFNVSPERGSYYCFGCGEKGDIFSFIEKIEGVDFRGALRILAEKAGVELTPYRGETGPTKDEKERLYELHEAAVSFFESELGKRVEVRQYLEGRGLTMDTIHKWHLGYAPAGWREVTEYLRVQGCTDTELITAGLSIKPEGGGDKGPYDRFRGRIMFPIFDAGGRPIAFSGRFFEKMPGSKEEDPAKYVNSPETPLFRKSHVLYGLDKARGSMRRSDSAILVEGQMDLLMMHQVGYTNTVAASGTALTEDHLRTIAHATKRLVLALDADQAGVRSAFRSALLAFGQGFELRVATFPDGKDPADIGKEDPEQLKDAIRKAQSAVEFFLSHVRAHTKDERAFRKAVEDTVLPLVAAMESRMDQAHHIQIISRATGLPEEDIRTEVGKIVPGKEQEVSAEHVVSPSVRIPRLQHAAALLFVAGPEGKDKMQKVLTEDQYREVEAIVESDIERFTIEFDSEAYGENSVNDLLQTVREELLSEDIRHTRQAHRQAQERGDAAEEERLMKKMDELTKRKNTF